MTTHPRTTSAAAGLFALSVVLLFLLATPVPGLTLAATVHPVSHAAPVSHAVVAAPAAPAASASRPNGVHPAIMCPPPPGQMDNPIGWVWPLTPSITYQSPCNPPIQQDEVHGWFGSNGAHSAERFTVPLFLPANGKPGQANSYNNTYVGMVVRGNPISAWNQSYAQIAFIPESLNGTFAYRAIVSVFSLMNNSVTKPPCTRAVPAPLVLFWNNSVWCEDNLVNNGRGFTMSPGLAPNSAVNVTFVGQKGSTTPLIVYMNDTTTPSASNSFSFSWTNTGRFNFTPFYNSSCPDACLLKWGMGFGLGIGTSICPGENGGIAACNSYNSSAWAGNPSVTWGSPEYFSGGSYSGDYYYFAPESASGECGGATAFVAKCNFNTQNGGNGYYPLFSFNGSQLLFGNLWPWSYETFGGTLQYPSNGAWRDSIPFFLVPYNSSLGSFVGSGNAFNVSGWLMDLGTVTGANLHYLEPGGSWTTIAMNRINGTTADGFWNATVPAGANGVVTYWISASNHAGANAFSGNYTVVRGPLPTFYLKLTTVPSNCGGVRVNGTLYPSGTNLPLYPGTHPFGARECYPYVFFNWSVSRGLFMSPNASVPSGQMLVTANGSLTGNWMYVRPLDTIDIATSPGSCGIVNINSKNYTNGGSLQLWDSLTATLKIQSGCGGYAFSGWTFTGNFTILGTAFTPKGNGTLTANFVADNVAQLLVFYTSPTTCGGVGFRGAGYTNGESINVAAGTYKLTPIGCAHFVFRNWSSSTASVSISNNNATVSSSGWIRETDQWATEILLQTSPSTCGHVQWDGTNYSSGSLITVANNSTHTAYGLPCNGYYFNGWATSFGIYSSGNLITVNNSGSVIAVFIQGTPHFFVAFLTDPSTCGSITFEGTKYSNAGSTKTGPSTVATLVPNTCSGYNFTRWLTSGGIVVVGGNAYINGSGSITAVFRPLVPILLYTIPVGCGSILLDHTHYLSNSTVALPVDKAFYLRAVPCAHYVFTGWSNTSGASVVGNSVFFTSSALITANFAPARYFVGISINPASCGAVNLGGQVVENGTTLGLTWGNYTLKPIPCAGDHLNGWSASGNLTVNSSGNVSVLSVNGSGQLGANYLPVPPSVSLSIGGGGYAGQPLALFATVGVPVPPYNYSYHWAFGDGKSVTTTENFTTHTYSSPGTYVVKMSLVDPYNRSANASLNVPVGANPSLAGAAIYWPGVAAIVVVVVALAIAGLIAARRRPPGPSEPTETFGEKPPEAAEGEFRAVNASDSTQQ